MNEVQIAEWVRKYLAALHRAAMVYTPEQFKEVSAACRRPR
jgi:hypothetical protein